LYEEEGERRMICGVVEERNACWSLRESVGDFCRVVLFLKWGESNRYLYLCLPPKPFLSPLFFPLTDPLSDLVQYYLPGRYRQKIPFYLTRMY